MKITSLRSMSTVCHEMYREVNASTGKFAKNQVFCTKKMFIVMIEHSHSYEKSCSRNSLPITPAVFGILISSFCQILNITSTLTRTCQKAQKTQIRRGRQWKASTKNTEVCVRYFLPAYQLHRKKKCMGIAGRKAKSGSC